MEIDWISQCLSDISWGTERSWNQCPTLALWQWSVAHDLIKQCHWGTKLAQPKLSPWNHWYNPIQRTIRGFKTHFIPNRSGADQNYPSNAWDLLLHHVINTLNMLKQSKINPKVSAYMLVKGRHAYNSHSIIPTEYMFIILYGMRAERHKWDKYDTYCYFIEKVPNHCRNFYYYTPDTRMTRISNTVDFYPTYYELLWCSNRH